VTKEKKEYSPSNQAVVEAYVPPALDGARLDRAAADLFPDYSRARLQAWIEEGRLLRDGAPAARTRDAVRAGDHLHLTIPGLPDAEPRAQAIALDVVYADEAIAVIDKPAGLIVHPGAGAPDGTLQNALLHRFPQTALVPRAGIVHRLDKDTSGLLVVALDLKAHARLVEAMAAREIRREYQAIVNGVLTAGGTVDAPIGRDPRNRLRMAVAASGRHAVTHYRVLERFTRHSHLRLRLETGRTHQIRVHMAHIRHAIVGDMLYGGHVQRGTALSDALRQQLRAFPRQALHACELALRHPVDGVERVFQSPLPDDMRMLLAALHAG
jgi:23S rRNA pseudouridine1911/1915/1917 synthase